MSLPKINNPTPVVVPPIPEKRFDEVFIREITITCSPAGKWRATIMYQPYSYDTGEINEKVNPGYIHIDDLKAEAAEDLDIAMVMYGLLDIVDKKLNPEEESDIEPSPEEGEVSPSPEAE